MPEEVPEDDSYEQLKADIAAAQRTVERAHRKAGSDLAAPPAPDSLQAVAEAMPRELRDAITVLGNRAFDLGVASGGNNAEDYAAKWSEKDGAERNLLALLARQDEELKRVRAEQARIIDRQYGYIT